MKTFEDLDCWKRITALRRELAELVKVFPAEEYRLTDQIIRAARSATSNIAEGYGRFQYQENIQYCRQTRGSLFEIMEHLIVAKDEGYISDSELISLKAN
jgi:four helix bundle protein